MVAAILKSTGGHIGSAAALTGVPARTWRYLRAGRNPSPANLARLRAVQRAIRVPPGRQAWLRTTGPKGPHIVVNVTWRISQDIRDRKVLISGWPRIPHAPLEDQVDGIMGRTLDPWLAGDDDTAEHVFMRPINAGIGMEVDWLDVKEIRLFRKRSDALRYLQT
jgi:hypothetical protein